MKNNRNTKIQKATPALIKKINSNIILGHIKNYKEGISRAQISREVSISEPTVSKIVSELTAKKILVHKGKGKTSLGRKPDLVYLNNEYGKIISLDLGPENTKIAIVDLYGGIIEKRDFQITGSTEEEKLDNIIYQIEDLKNKYCDKGQRLIRIILGIPGIIDSGHGKISYAHTFPNWKYFPIKKTLEKKLKIKVSIENDVNLDALGELNYGFRTKPSSLLFMTWSKGFGAGIILNGSIFRGHNGAAGEMGYAVTRKNGMDYKIPKTGYPGYLESILSTTRIIDRAINHSKKNPESGLFKISDGKFKDVSFEMIVELYRINDPVCSQIIEDAFDTIAAGIINGIIFLNPEYVVIGGDASDIFKKDKYYLNKIKEKIENHVPFMPEIRWSNLGADAGIMGGISYYLENLYEILV